MAIPLYETASYMVFSDQEEFFLFDKDLNKELWRYSMYGNATCAQIDLIAESWVAVGGEHLFIWKDGKSYWFKDSDLKHIFDFKQVKDTYLHILTDPWSGNSAVWEFDLTEFSWKKLRSFDDYRERAYTDDVEW